jgi:hypothetical protein
MSFSQRTFFKMAPICVRLAQDSYQEQDFRPVCSSVHGSRLPLEHLKIREKDALGEIML